MTGGAKRVMLPRSTWPPSLRPRSGPRWGKQGPTPRSKLAGTPSSRQVWCLRARLFIEGRMKFPLPHGGWTSDRAHRRRPNPTRQKTPQPLQNDIINRGKLSVGTIQVQGCLTRRTNIPIEGRTIDKHSILAEPRRQSLSLPSCQQLRLRPR